MITIQRFVCNPIQENTYVVSDETGEAVIIDCGAFDDTERQAIRTYIDENGLRPVSQIATHAHLDHIFGTRFIYDTYGLKLDLHREEASVRERFPMQAAALLNLNVTLDDLAPVGRWLDGNDTVTFGTHRFDTIETPGHTPGGVFYYCKDEAVAFSGDTLFRSSIGRTDFPGGSMFMLIQSLRAVCQLPDDTTIYAGHGEATTIGREVAHNPYLDR